MSINEHIQPDLDARALSQDFITAQPESSAYPDVDGSGSNTSSKTASGNDQCSSNGQPSSDDQPSGSHQPSGDKPVSGDHQQSDTEHLSTAVNVPTASEDFVKDVEDKGDDHMTPIPMDCDPDAEGENDNATEDIGDLMVEN